MISVSEAVAIIQENTFPLHKEEIDITYAAGRILAEAITADRDFPPFNRVAMDGIAIDSKAYGAGQTAFRVEGVQAAGAPPQTLKEPEGCIEVMTGAVLPDGTNAVIRYEDVVITEGVAHIHLEQLMANQNIHSQGKDAKQGEIILHPGQKLSPAEVALMASVGKSKVNVHQLPQLAILSTGDELVAIEETPLPYQIRRSNDATLKAALAEDGFRAQSFHLKDNPEILEENLRQILNDHPLVILSGGVSKGKFDYLPKTLEKLGIQRKFHGIRQRPGKPFWFGHSDSNIVFSLPGNPVSTYLCYYRYIKPWIFAQMNSPFPESTVILEEDYSFAPPLTYFLQVKVTNRNGQLYALPFTGGGSGDFANLAAVDGFLELPADKTEFKAGEVFSFIPFR